MTHHDDSMRLLRTQRSNHSNHLHKPQAHMRHQALWRDSDKPTTCNSRLRQRKHRVAPVMTRNSCTTSRKACNTRQARTCQQTKCSTHRNTNHKSRDSRPSNTSSMELVQCMACSQANSKPNQRTIKCQLSDNHGPALHLRHCPPSLASHQRHNTTLRDKTYQLAHLPQSSQHHKFLRSIRNQHTLHQVRQHSKHTRCLILRSRPPIRHTINNRNIPQHSLRSSNSRRSLLTSYSTSTRYRFGPFSRGPERAICERTLIY